jgi:hypothetical protein
MDTKKLFAKYDLVVNNVDKITNKIKAGRVNSIKDNSSLQTMFDSNVEYIHQMEELIIAGQLKYQELNEKLAVMDGNPSAYQDYEIADLRDYVNRLDKRLADLKSGTLYYAAIAGADPCGAKQQYHHCRKGTVDRINHHPGLEKPVNHCRSAEQAKGQCRDAEENL